MQDSIFTLPWRQGAVFTEGFHFQGWIEGDTALSTVSGLPPEAVPFLFPSGSGVELMAQARPVAPMDWIFGLILIGFLLLTIARFYYEKRIGLLTSAVFSRSSANQLIRESHIMRHQSFLYLIAIYLISITLLIFQSFRHFDPGSAGNWKDILLYLEISGAFMAFFLVKMIIIRITGFIFRNPETASEYIQNIYIFNLTGGIILLPLLLLIGFTSLGIFLFVAFGVLVLLMILRFLRGFFIGLSDRRYSLFHLFLYLCTLEILPVLVLAKFADKYFFS